LYRFVFLRNKVIPGTFSNYHVQISKKQFLPFVKLMSWISYR